MHADKALGVRKLLTDLRPCLQAWGHTLILDEGGSDSIHSHPTIEVPVKADLANIHNPPEISFRAYFPKPAFYRVWSQFERHGHVSDYVFTIQVHRLQ